MPDTAAASMPLDADVLHQRERTIDNIKRIYAVVYSISITNVLRLIFDCVNLYAPQGDNVHLPLRPDVAEGLTIRLVMLAIFATTIAVFAFQADKFLDIR